MHLQRARAGKNFYGEGRFGASPGEAVQVPVLLTHPLCLSVLF